MPDAIPDYESDLLGDAEQSALAARATWLQSAWNPANRPGPGAVGKQIPPSAINWEVLIWRCGRNFGKTRAESEWLWWEMWQFPRLLGHYLAATLGDVRGTIFEGPSGLRAVIPAECLEGRSWDQACNINDKTVMLANGSVIKGFATTQEARRLRGPACHALAGDELAWWDQPAGNLQDALDVAMLGVRMPWPDKRPARAVFGTTPRTIPFLKNFERRKNTIVVTGSSYENMPQTADSYRNKLLSHEGTQIARQEIYGEYVEDEDFGIFKRSWFRLWPKDKKLPVFSFIVMSLDTASKEQDYDPKKRKTDPSACTVWGIFNIPQNFTSDETRKMGARGRYAALLCDAWDEYLDFPDLCDKVRKQYTTKWGMSPGKRADILLIEDKSSGIQLRQVMLRYNLPAWPYNPNRASKTMRAHAIAPYAKNGCFFIPESGREDRKGQPRDWCEPFLEQVCAFKGEGSTQFDDYVDAFTQAGIYLSSRDMLSFNPLEGIPIDYEEKRAKDIEDATRRYEETKPAGNYYAE